MWTAVILAVLYVRSMSVLYSVTVAKNVHSEGTAHDDYNDARSIK